MLAFAIQDWDEGEDIKERTLIALCNVKSELNYNRILIESDYIPRQQGMLALTKASISALRRQPDLEVPMADLKQMRLQESLRYSAWTLAGESGYLLHANFQLATEIGALIDYQEDRYQRITRQINELIIHRNDSSQQDLLPYYLLLTDLLTEWTTQTNYLQNKYQSLFAREDFIALNCESK